MTAENTIQISIPIRYKNMDPNGPEMAKAMMEGISRLVESGALNETAKEKDLINFEYSNDTGYALVTLNKSCLKDASKLNTINGSLVSPIVIDGDVIDKDAFKIKDKEYSTASIQERLRISSLDPKMQFRYMILDYRKYYKSKKAKLDKDPEQLRKLKDMFLVDMMGIFNKIMPALMEGKQLAALTGLNNVSEGLMNISKELSISYRRALKQAKEGSISKSNLQSLQKQYAQFMNLLIPQVFPGIEKVEGVGTPRAYSEVSDEKEFGWVKIACNCPDKLKKLIEEIKRQLEDEDRESFEVNIGDKNNPELSLVFNPTHDKIESFEGGKVRMRNTLVSKEYSYWADGRIKLFN